MTNGVLFSYIGVPVSTQWSENSGNHHFYAVQVAQYGLSHYSKNLSEPPPKRTIFEDGNVSLGKFQIPSGGYVRRHFDQALHSHIVEFNSRGKIIHKI